MAPSPVSGVSPPPPHNPVFASWSQSFFLYIFWHHSRNGLATLLEGFLPTFALFWGAFWDLCFAIFRISWKSENCAPVQAGASFLKPEVLQKPYFLASVLATVITQGLGCHFVSSCIDFGSSSKPRGGPGGAPIALRAVTESGHFRPCASSGYSVIAKTLQKLHRTPLKQVLDRFLTRFGSFSEGFLVRFCTFFVH